MVVSELKRYLTNYSFYVAIIAVTLLLLFGKVYISPETGKEYTVFDMTKKENLNYVSSHGGIEREEIFLKNPDSYLWMFVPIIAAIPFSMLICAEKKNSLIRFELYRVGKNRFVMGKLLAAMMSGGLIVMAGYLLYLAGVYIMIPKVAGMGYGTKYYMITYSRLCRWTEKHLGIMGLYLLKLIAMFLYGMFSVIPAFFISGFMKNRYMILCIPMIMNYFWIMFVQKSSGNVIRYLNPEILHSIYLIGNKRNIFLGVFALMIIVAAITYRICLERRCDCGEC